MKHFHVIAFLLFCNLHAQCVYGQQADTAQFPAHFSASWIAPPRVSLQDYGVYHFRRMLHLQRLPKSFVVQVSADNRYQLYVNGHNVTSGPQRSDVAHWHYETLDLRPYLQSGTNVIAATVWNQGRYRAWAQLSLQTGFWMDGALRSDTSWRVLNDTAYTPLTEGAHITGPFEALDAAQYPWNWQQPGYDDQAWPHAILSEKAIPAGNAPAGTRGLLARNIPLPENTPQHFARIRRHTGVNVTDTFLQGGHAFTVPAHTQATLLIDQGTLTTAYPELLISGGKAATITLSYAEALTDDKTHQKGNRNEIDGKSLHGNKDRFVADGGNNRLFRPLYYRTFRYVEMQITTGMAPLLVKDLSSRFTAYPFVRQARFASSDTSLQALWDMSWRTSRLCAYETYMDCPYYEQLQYIGDTRIQALISLYTSGDARLMENAIRQFDQSRLSYGLTQSRYPSGQLQVIPPFSLFWILMLHDHWMLRDDPSFVTARLEGVRAVLDWHATYIDSTGMLGAMPHWNFVDWPAAWPWKGLDSLSGVPPSALTGHSAVLTLQYAYALQQAAILFRAAGDNNEATHCEALATGLNAATYRACWNAGKGLLADDPSQQQYSQHTNVMGVLSGAIPPSQQAALLQRMVQDTQLVQCTIYYRFYLVQAFKKAGLGEAYLDLLQPWRNMAAMGLTTFAERPEPTRSDCHAWSASPAYDLLATVCGISPSAAGFRQVRIAPALGSLQWVEGAMPHPRGLIEVRFEKKGNGLQGRITLPPGLSGVLTWKGQQVSLQPGTQTVHLAAAP
ncbi:alpha-L-rhamnosidase [Chitinophaga parva]|uniref:Alpha-L-rhamnosidase n=2 Tax=Chitinophaga parva TaxID=2169414 RepID=A0A2T7BQD1_9BACT|nr:alpha-L-rhamnosidase [Chitinophaga parva]